MNSTLGNELLFDKAPKTGTGDVIVSVQALNPFLVPPITPENQPIANQIETLVDDILKIQNTSGYFGSSEKQKRVKELEKQINKYVYQLYDLTPAEIRLVEKNES